MGSTTGATVVAVRVNGALVPFTGKPKFNLGGWKRSQVESDFTTGLHTKTRVGGMVEFEAFVNDQASLGALGDLEDASVTLEYDIGGGVQYEAMATEEVPEVSDGKATLKLFGPPGVEFGR